jgi:uncharacterized protein
VTASRDIQTPIIDCDVHPAVPSMKALLPYLEPHWRETVIEREVNLESQSYPPGAPLSARPDLRDGAGIAGADPKETARVVFGRWGADIAILNCLYGVQLVMNEDMAVVLTRALNDWIAREWLDADPRFRAAIVVPLQNPQRAVEEIERHAADKRFVQILVLAMGEVPLGRRQLWPVWAAAERHGLPIGIHAGSAYRHPVTSLGWPSTYIEDYSAQSLGFQGQVASLITEGVFQKFPALKVVLIESGVTWLPPLLWRLSKFWRGVRAEVPWVDRPPADIMRDHIRLTVQPFDVPGGGVEAQRVIEHLGSDDVLLYASDYPHWQFDGDHPMPSGIPERLHQKIRSANALATYPRLAASLLVERGA